MKGLKTYFIRICSIVLACLLCFGWMDALEAEEVDEYLPEYESLDLNWRTGQKKMQNCQIQCQFQRQSQSCIMMMNMRPSHLNL